MLSTKRIEFRRVRDFGEIINATFAFTQQNFKPLAKAVLFIAGPVVLIEGIFSGLTQGESVYGRDFYSGLFWAQYAVFILSALFAAVLVSGVVYEYVILYLAESGEEIGVEEVWQAVRKDFGLIFWTSLGAGALYLLGFVLCLLPGVYLVIVLAPIVILRLRERVSFGEAVSRCRHLMAEHWWTGFALLFVATLIVYAVVFVFQLPQAVLTVVSTLTKIDGANTGIFRAMFMLTSIVAAFAGTLSYVFPSLVASFFYFNLVERKEARGLMDKLDQITPTN